MTPPAPSMINRAARWLLAVGSHLAPGTAAELAARAWFSIPTRNVHTTAVTQVPGGTAFEAVSERRVVRGHVWGEGPVVYLVHGWGADSQQMTPLVEPILRSGCRVVAFDGPGHGCSDPGALGPGRSHAVEFGKALDAVAAVHGPARAVVAHSLGAMATMLTLRFGWTSVDRLVFLAPMAELRSYLDQFSQQLRLSHQARRRLDATLEATVGLTVSEFDIAAMLDQADGAPLLVAHDRTDPRAPWAASVQLVERWPGAELLTTSNLGHNRLIADPAVADIVAGFIAEGGASAADPPGSCRFKG